MGSKARSRFLFFRNRLRVLLDLLQELRGRKIQGDFYCCEKYVILKMRMTVCNAAKQMPRGKKTTKLL